MEIITEKVNSLLVENHNLLNLAENERIEIEKLKKENFELLKENKKYIFEDKKKNEKEALSHKNSENKLNNTLDILKINNKKLEDENAELRQYNLGIIIFLYSAFLIFKI